MKLLIRNLNRKTKEKKIHSLFAKFGRVSSCTLVGDKKSGDSKGFGFVEMAEAIDGEKAIKALNESMVEGYKIRVKAANEPKASEEDTSTEE